MSEEIFIGLLVELRFEHFPRPSWSVLPQQVTGATDRLACFDQRTFGRNNVANDSLLEISKTAKRIAGLNDDLACVLAIIVEDGRKVCPLPIKWLDFAVFTHCFAFLRAPYDSDCMLVKHLLTFYSTVAKLRP